MTDSDDDVPGGDIMVQCDCWWSAKDDEFGDGERMTYSDVECPVHAKDEG